MIVVFNAKCFRLFTLGKSQKLVLKIRITVIMFVISWKIFLWICNADRITGSLNNRQIFNIYYHSQRGYNIGEMELMLFIYLYSNSSLDNIPVALTTTSFWLKLSITTFMASSLVITNLNKIKISIKKIFFFFSYIKMNITYNFYLNDPYFTSMHLKNIILCFDVFRSDLHFIV